MQGFSHVVDLFHPICICLLTHSHEANNRKRASKSYKCYVCAIIQKMSMVLLPLSAKIIIIESKRSLMSSDSKKKKFFFVELVCVWATNITNVHVFASAWTYTHTRFYLISFEASFTFNGKTSILSSNKTNVKSSAPEHADTESTIENDITIVVIEDGKS